MHFCYFQESCFQKLKKKDLIDLNQVTKIYFYSLSLWLNTEKTIISMSVLGSKLATAPGSSSRIFHAEFRPDSDSHFVTVGVKHVKFWTIVGSQLVGKKGIMSSIDNVSTQPQMQTMLSVAFSAVRYVLEIIGQIIWSDILPKLETMYTPITVYIWGKLIT